MVQGEFLALAADLGALPETAWDTPSLCEGWRVREVVAHVTMPARYGVDEFMAELAACEGDFTRLSNLIAARDSSLPTGTLVANLRDPVMHGWAPPGGGAIGALSHVVIHGLDVAVPLGIERPPGEGIRTVVASLAEDGAHQHFGFSLDGLRLRANDIEWSHGSGTTLTGRAGDLILLMAGRALPEGMLSRSADGRY